MKRMKQYYQAVLVFCGCCLLTLFCNQLIAQNVTDSTKLTTDSTVTAATNNTQPEPAAKRKAVRNTFQSNWIQDNQTVMVPIKGTFEMDIQHRFGIISKGAKDFFGLYAPSNIRIGFSYVVINKLLVGFGFTKDRMQFDLNGKYALIKQDVTGGWPVSISWFSNVVLDARPKENFVTYGDRFSYFHQLLIARKITDKFSAQVAPSLSHYNNIEGFLDANGKVQPKMKNDHFAIAFMGRYRMTQKTNFLVNYDQPITQHNLNNPHPNISFGLEMVTSAHAFQVFFSNYQGIIPQSNNMFNQNDYTKGQFCIGFNITRLWNF